MAASRPRNFHVPLDEDLHKRLRQEAARAGKPATQLAREAIEAALRERQRLILHESIAQYAAAAAGTDEDLDPVFERAARQHLTRRKRGP